MNFRLKIFHLLFFRRARSSVRAIARLLSRPAAPVIPRKLVFASSWLILPVNLLLFFFSGLRRSNSRGNGKSQSPQQSQNKTRARNRWGGFISVTQSLRDEPKSLPYISLHYAFGGAQLSQSFISHVSASVATSTIPRAQQFYLFCIDVLDSGTLGAWKESARWCRESEKENRGRSQGEENEARVRAVWPFQWGYDVSYIYDCWVKTVDRGGILLTYPLLVLVDHNKA